jgi:hypothetical protein
MFVEESSLWRDHVILTDQMSTVNIGVPRTGILSYVSAQCLPITARSRKWMVPGYESYCARQLSTRLDTTLMLPTECRRLSW